MADLEICQRNKFGNCKNNQQCKLKHEKEMCKSNTCKVSQCQKRHRKNVVGLKIWTDVNLVNVPTNT